MHLQHQPDTWSCLVTALAMVLDEPVENLIKEIGHDGSEIIRPKEFAPFCYRGFHIQELVKICLKRNKGLIQLDIEPIVYDGKSIVKLFNDLEFIKLILPNEIGILTGYLSNTNSPHAVAWNGKHIYDSNFLI